MYTTVLRPNRAISKLAGRLPSARFTDSSLSLLVLKNHYQKAYSTSIKPKPSQIRGSKLKYWAIPASALVLYGLYGIINDSAPADEEVVVKPVGPWQVAAYSTIPLKAISRLWGDFNGIILPVWMREPGYKLYSYIFGANLDEVAEPDLKVFANLGEFFFRKLKDGARPIDQNAPLVSPSDGKVLRLGSLDGEHIEQVKGVSYSMSALLGSTAPRVNSRDSPSIEFSSETNSIKMDEEFAVLNGMHYSVDDLIVGEKNENIIHQNEGDATGTETSVSDVLEVSKNLASGVTLSKKDNKLFYAVIYLAPGDYHRFHSPTNWVSMVRRHFVGELYSVAPYFQKRLSGLFVLNERVALLGKWKYGFFSMTPVGATNVGSIKLHFDKDLKTNHRSHNNADGNTCFEATYANASKLLGGYPLTKGQEMGGFQLGSTVVLVFEAPKDFSFSVKAGDVVRVGQELGKFD
ncbi:phosphatidylserine decarboxylase [Nadsonia fulvescens var. elongata DSM 6958]|uniref:Phosphatidylserine decarboxylase proenzyme 1, mitochondrial n=1 Tax=Nadsonia fulvescens var. elongata DSM 6958 TaxID=857566 RepID=A0A1E3PKW4_9ASCO|nr:phosphatidylserine decarboxylase [Nadsonia fulvescens var. elongata DSM 6958]